MLKAVTFWSFLASQDRHITEKLQRVKELLGDFRKFYCIVILDSVDHIV